jgi:hypothetical protein
MKKYICFFSIILQVVLLSIPVIAADSKKDSKEAIAVVEFEGQNVSSMDAAVVSGFLRTSLVNLNVYRVVDRQNMESVLAEQGFQMTGCTTEECAVKIGKLLNVQKIIIGSLSKLMGVFYITGNIVNVETGEITVSKRVKCLSGEDIADAVDLLAKQLVYPDKYEGAEQPVKKAEPEPKTQVQQEVQQQETRQQAAKQPEAVPAKKTSKRPKMFFEFLTGSAAGSMDLSFSNSINPIDEIDLSLDFDGDGTLESNETLTSLEFEDLEVAKAANPFTLRFGIYEKVVGMDFDMSYYNVDLKAQDTEAVYDGWNETSFSFYVDDYFNVRTLSLGLDLFLLPEKGPLYPYIGGGIGMTINTLESPYIYSYDDSGISYSKPFVSSKLGYLFRFILGGKLMLGESFAFLMEYRVSKNSVSFNRGITGEEDKVKITLKQLLWGLSLVF